jgi:DNA-binding beta-propeller fold protein YncE
VDATITVRGSASDADGVLGVRVNGVLASTTDGFATWSATVPLAPGDNAIVVRTIDVAGAFDLAADAVAVRREGPLPTTVLDAAFDPAGVRVILVDPAEAVLGTTLVPAERETVSSDLRGGGVALRDPGDPYPLEAVVVDPALGVAYVADEGIDERILRVHLATGDRVVVSDAVTGSGPAVDRVEGLALDAAGGRLFAACFSGEVYEIDVASGDRTLLADGLTVGSGPEIERPEDVEFDPTSGRPYVLDSLGKSVFTIDPATLARTLVTGPTLGTGPALSISADEIALELDEGRLFVADGETVYAVDVATGDRTTFSDADVGAGLGPEIGSPVALDLDAAHGRLILVERTGRVLSLDLASGDRFEMHRPGFGTGPIDTPADVAVDPATRNVLFLVTDPEGALVEIDRATGDRRTVADDAALVPPFLGGARYVAAGATPGTAHLSDGLSVFEVTLATGARRVVSDASTGTGPLGELDDVAEGLVPGRLVVASRDEGLLSVDVASGDREVIAPLASFADFGRPYGVATDPLDQRVFVADNSADEAIAVDAPTGAVAVLEDGFEDLGDCAADLVGESLWLVDDGDALLALDLVGGATAVVADTAPSGTISLGGVSRVDADPLRRLAVVVDPHVMAIVAVDGVTGQRVLLAR